MGKHRQAALSATEITTKPPAKRKKKRRRKGGCIPLLLLLAGLAVLCYPVVAMQYNTHRQEEVAKAYQSQVQQLDDNTKTQALAAAEYYNDHAQLGGLKDPWSADPSGRSQVEGYDQYMQQLNVLGENSPMSQLTIPAIGVVLPVYHGTAEATLQKGVGHLFGSSLPVGMSSSPTARGTHAVMTGHTGLTNATLFDNLSHVKEGDVFYLSTYGRTLKYQVDQIKVVLPEDTHELLIQPGRDLVTLITCTPYGINSHRLLVRGSRVPMDEKDAAQVNSSHLHWAWWMLLILGITGGILLILLLLLLRRLWLAATKKKKQQEEEKASAAAAKAASQQA